MISLGLIVRSEPVFFTYCFNQIEAPWQGRTKVTWDKEWTRYHAEKTLTLKKEERISKKAESGKLWRSQLIIANAAFKRQFHLL